MSDESSIEMIPELMSTFPIEDLSTPTSESRIRVRRRFERTAKWKAKGRAERALTWRKRPDALGRS